MTQDHTDFITQIQLLISENQASTKRLDEQMNLVAAQKEEIQQLRDEIAVLKGQKPRPKNPTKRIRRI